MPIINISDLVQFAPNYGVMVKREAIEQDPVRLHEMVGLAWQHMDDPWLRDACCGGSGPLARYSELRYEVYVGLVEQITIDEETKIAKRDHTRIRRTQFSGRRSQLVLAMIESGVPYVCRYPACNETRDLTIDHVVPLSRGGTDDLANLQFLCRGHNSSKSDSLET